MISEQIESRAGSVVWACLFLVTGLSMFLLIGFFGDTAHSFAVGAAVAMIPLGIAIALFLCREKAVRFQCEETGLVFQNPEMIIPYEHLQAVVMEGIADKRFPIQIHHKNGVIRLPENTNVDNLELLNFLQSKVPPPSALDVPESLQQYLKDQVEKFGLERVSFYLARPRAKFQPQKKSVYGCCGICLGAIAMGVIGGVLNNDKETPPIIGFAIMIFFFTLLIGVLVSRSRKVNLPSNWSQSSLIITPIGFALSQGPLKGKLRWDEVKSIDFPAKAQTSITITRANKASIGVAVAGAYIVIEDYYDQSINSIRTRLMEYWRED